MFRKAENAFFQKETTNDVVFTIIRRCFIIGVFVGMLP